MVHTMKDQTRATAPGRRSHDREFKADLVARSLQPGASVSAIAMNGGVNANLLFKWRRDQVRARGSAAPEAATLLPVCVVPQIDAQTQVRAMLAATAPAPRASRLGVIELEIAGAQLRLRGAVDEAMLSSVLRALRHST
ncbi:MAG: transposase [Caldimonas sp.]